MKNAQSRKWKGERGYYFERRKAKGERGNYERETSLCYFHFPLSTFHFHLAPVPSPQSPSRGMTLIELMVVIVILTLLVGGVLPLVSPNNDARKIAEAARGLQTYLMQAQAEAARTGRPVGVGFRETIDGSGVAIEAFQMIVPKPFPGSSSMSRVGVDALPDANTDSYYGSASTGTSDISKILFKNFVKSRLYAVSTRLALLEGNSIVVDPVPPGMFRVGDVIDAQGNRFVIVDDFRHWFDEIGGLKFLNPKNNQTGFENKLICVRLDEVRMGSDAQPLAVPPSGYSYSIHRQPLGADVGGAKSRSMISSADPYQLPAGVCIDLQASGLEAGGEPQTFSEFDELGTGALPSYMKQISIMFSPNGGIDGVWFNGGTIESDRQSGNKFADLSRVFLLLGRIENQNPDRTSFEISDTATDEEVREARTKVNWLNADSRWMMISANDGRFSVEKNAVFDPREPEHGARVGGQSSRSLEATKIVQIEAAHELGHQH
jgi:prepilin-type N-terminal cleavage/methylation domain-containing protein